MEYNTELRFIEDRFLILNSEREKRLSQLECVEKEKEELISKIETYVNSIEFVESVAESERSYVKEKVESLITSCLRSVYDDSYKLEFRYGMKSYRSAVEILVTKECNDNMVITRNIDGIGGGVADSISVPLKLIVLLNDQSFSNVLICDEQGKHLDEKRVENFGEFLKKISESLGVQILMSTHHSSLVYYADSVYSVSINDSVSSVEKIK